MSVDAQNSAYVVFLYCDYRKAVDIQHIKAFYNHDEAIDFAKKYSGADTPSEYILIKGTEYDAPFYGNTELDALENSGDSDEVYKIKYDEINTKINNFKKELGIKRNMWYIRIAVDKINIM